MLTCKHKQSPEWQAAVRLRHYWLLAVAAGDIQCQRQRGFSNVVFWDALTNVSGYVCNHGSPNGERDTASPRGRYGGTPSAWLVSEDTYVKTPPVGRRQPMTSLPAWPQYRGRRENTSSASSSEACVRSMAQSLGDAVSHSPFGEPWLHT